MPARWLSGLQERAEAVLPAPVAEYVACGAGAGTTRDEAAGAWARHRLAPRVLRGSGGPELGTQVLGTPSPVCWGWAPISLQREVHPDGELAVARASAAAGVLDVVSSNAGTSFADIGATGVRWWLQAYLTQDRELTRPLLESAAAAGAEAVVLTVDTPVVATKHGPGPSVWDVVDGAGVRVNFPVGHDQRPGAQKATDLGPDDVAWLAASTGLPVVVKGVLRADDARRCVEAGAAGVWVSNHGGRQLDRALSTADALPGVAAAVREAGGEVAVLVDGGLRGGLDVLTALALGADLALIGRPVSWALVDGQPGVERLHDELHREVAEAFRLAGCTRVADTREVLAHICRGPHTL